MSFINNLKNGNNLIDMQVRCRVYQRLYVGPTPNPHQISISSSLAFWKSARRHLQSIGVVYFYPNRYSVWRFHWWAYSAKLIMIWFNRIARMNNQKYKHCTTFKGYEEEIDFLFWFNCINIIDGWWYFIDFFIVYIWRLESLNRYLAVVVSLWCWKST